ncbi:MAG: hypothetical protein NTV06_01100, partial [candidate division Zixibacteria bacterium]|nr:hypothetical protein [candidate division Zixibacteria bacterium]
MKLKKQLGVAWIADFRDLWFSLPIEMVYRNQRNRSYALDLRKKIVETADEVVSVNNDIRRYLGRGEIIMNGADIDSSKYWQNAPNHQKDILKIGILGTANHLCPIEPLFRAVKLLLARNPSLKSRLSIIHIGHYDHKILAGILEAGLNDIVTMKGYLPKNEAIRSLAAVDLLYLGVDKFGDYNILPGRIFDYLISGKLILGVLPNDSEAAALLKEYGNSAIFSKENIEEISVYLAGLLCSGDKKNKTERLDTLDLGKYSSLATAQKYAALLDRLLK